MKKLIFLIIGIFIVIFIYNVVINNAKDYKLDYKVDGYEVSEKYNKDKAYYVFTIKDKDKEYKFISTEKYRSSRKIIDKIDISDKTESLCLKPVVKDMKFSYLCYENNQIIGEHISSLGTYTKPEFKKKSFNTDLYSIGYYFYLWTNDGFTELVNKKIHKVFDQEYYDNNLSYKFNDYIIFADYEQKRDFNKFYILDTGKREVDTFEFKDRIDYDSYFMGDIEGFIFLFDRKNSVQYKIDIENKKISKVSNKEDAKYYDNGWKKKSINELKYYTVTMKEDKVYNYELEDGKLYLNIDGVKMLVTKYTVTDIVQVSDDVVYYLVEDSVYKYKYNGKEEKLLTNFDWQFSYKNKIYIFD